MHVSRAVALLRAAHIEPTLAVTGLATALAASAGRSVAGTVLVALTVLTGQLSIGWSNDLLDARRDEAAGRRDKPLAQGEIAPRSVAVACAAAAVTCVPLSFGNGWRAGVAHLLVVAGGWAYNLGLKATALSWLPYATSFGLLAAFISLGLPGHPAPELWAVAAGSLLGVGAHFLNVLPDIDDDLSAGVRGLPHRLGRRAAQATGALLLALATIVITVGPDEPATPWVVAAMVLALGLAGLAAGWPQRRSPSRSKVPFLLALATAAVSILMLVTRGSSLS